MISYGNIAFCSGLVDVLAGFLLHHLRQLLVQGNQQSHIILEGAGDRAGREREVPHGEDAADSGQGDGEEILQVDDPGEE